MATSPGKKSTDQAKTLRRAIKTLEDIRAGMCPTGRRVALRLMLSEQPPLGPECPPPPKKDICKLLTAVIDDLKALLEQVEAANRR